MSQGTQAYYHKHYHTNTANIALARFYGTLVGATCCTTYSVTIL